MICRNHPSISEGVVRCSSCLNSFCHDCLVSLQGQFYCATCKMEQVRNLQSGVDPMSLDLAGLGRRFAAITIDGFVVGIPLVILIVLTMIPMFMKKTSEPPILFFVGIFIIPLVLNVLYEGLMLQSRGQTLGKMAMHIKVISAAGGPISKGQAWGRTLVRTVLVSYLALINYLPAFFTKERTCVHDLAAKTRVINWSA